MTKMAPPNLVCQIYISDGSEFPLFFQFCVISYTNCGLTIITIPTTVSNTPSKIYNENTSLNFNL